METFARPPVKTDSDTSDVVYVLLLLQGAIGLVAGLGLLAFTQGNPLAMISGFGKPALLFALAAGASRRWRWTRKATMAVEVLSLMSVAAGTVIGLAGEVDFTLNLVTLLTNVALPVGVIGLLMRPDASDGLDARRPLAPTANDRPKVTA